MNVVGATTPTPPAGRLSSPPTFRVQCARWLLPLALFVASVHAQDPRVLLVEGQDFWKRGHYTQALETFRKVVDAHPDRPEAAEAQFWLGKVCYYQWSLERAAAEFQQVVERYPQSEWAAVAQRWRGDCFFFAQDYEKAMAEYEKVVTQFRGSSETPAALYAGGKCAEKIGDGRRARTAYERLVVEFPGGRWANQARFELLRMGQSR